MPSHHNRAMAEPVTKRPNNGDAAFEVGKEDEGTLPEVVSDPEELEETIAERNERYGIAALKLLGIPSDCTSQAKVRSKVRKFGGQRFFNNHLRPDNDPYPCGTYEDVPEDAMFQVLTNIERAKEAKEAEKARKAAEKEAKKAERATKVASLTSQRELQRLNKENERLHKENERLHKENERLRALSNQ